MSLLCASLAWQQSYKALLQAIAASKNNPAAAVDAISSLLLQATGSSSADVTDFKVPKIIYVNFDSATLGMDDVGERPWDRAFFRDMSMALLDLGKARVLAFDFAFTPKSVSKMVPKVNSFRSDSAMGELVKSYPNNVVLGCVYSGVSTPFVNDTLADPFPPFFMSGYTEQESSENFRFHYPESPTYPMQSFVNNQYLGRSGSFTVPP